MFSMRNEKIIIFILTTFAFVITIVSGDLLLINNNYSASIENAACEKIQSSEFPSDLFTKTQRKCGAIILHVIFAVYCFGAIARVCSERFLPTISCICEDLKLSDDVAAATFMSIATSTPELFSNIIGTFITQSDIGIGHIIGNGFYNMFVVAAVGGMAAKQEITLEWWPLTRDCVLYAFVALILTGVVWDGIVKTYETLILLSLYIIYFIIMFNNKKIFNFVCHKLNIEITTIQKKNLVVNNTVVRNNSKDKDIAAAAEELDLEDEFTLPPPIPNGDPNSITGKEDRWKIIKKIFLMPINFFIRYTIPNVRMTEVRKYYPIAFIICVTWIGVSTYFGTWMVSVIGETFGIPDLIMGLVFMAAGGSVVEAYCVFWNAKRGQCDIGLSNALGCNNLDATLCLALPWLIKLLLTHTSNCNTDSSNITLQSSLIHINCLLLVISVIALLSIFYLNKFKLDKKLGFISGGVYAAVLIIAISVESYGKND